MFLSCLSNADTTIPAGDVSGTWTQAGSPYLIEGEITIPNGETLTIDPGVLVEFQGHYKFNVQGQLLAVGTEQDSIHFTVANLVTSWHGIRFDNVPVENDSSKIVYCHLEYGKNVWGGGASTLDALTDTEITSVASGEVLVWNGTTDWINATLNEAGIAALTHGHTASDVSDFDTEVGNHTDVAANTSARHSSHTAADISDVAKVGDGANTGDIAYWNDATSAWVMLARGQNTQVLKGVTGGAPTWGTITASHISDVAALGAAADAGDVLIANGTGWQRLAPGVAGKYLKCGGTGVAASWDTPAGGGGGTAYINSTPVSDYDVSGKSVLMIDSSGGGIEIRGFTGGVDGQRLTIVLLDPTAGMVIDHLYGGQTQPIFVKGEPNYWEYTAQYDTAELVFFSGDWYLANHVAGTPG